MMIGDFSNWQTEKRVISSALAEKLEYLRLTPFEQMEDGVYPALDDGTYLIIQHKELQPYHEVMPEQHRSYVDIHFMISGMEKMGFARDCGRNKAVAVTPEVDDHTFFEAVEAETELVLFPGQYIVLLPSDIHRPWCRADGMHKVRKALLKVPVCILELQ
ncbi:YhcH/YjgK/YiaL family protein [Candidatus Pristimantibacillus sp. PTI5]|uniref:YhcH/YjgK/YiaL family protein n=1 Tax=Candidatus Pristimantibacillus sp. PTI5 TaxID=3400422 RepID=UPI003B026D55